MAEPAYFDDDASTDARWPAQRLGLADVITAPTASSELCQLRQAMVSRAQIGVAKGLLASRYGCTTDQALALLVRISQTSNIKLRQIARVLQSSFDGVALTDEESQTLAVVVAHLPAGGWPPATREPHCS